MHCKIDVRHSNKAKKKNKVFEVVKKQANTQTHTQPPARIRYVASI